MEFIDDGQWASGDSAAFVFAHHLGYLDGFATLISAEIEGSGIVESIRSLLHRHPGMAKVGRRPPSRAQRNDTADSLRKSWMWLARLEGAVSHPFGFDPQLNMALPTDAYYAVYHAGNALLHASGATVPDHHRGVLNQLGQRVASGLFPSPWGMHAVGLPAAGSSPCLDAAPRPGVLMPAGAQEAVAQMLASTRRQLLDEKFAAEREKGVRPGRTRRNLTRQEKERMAAKQPPTTVFDYMYRLRCKAHYRDPDALATGARHAADAHAFADRLATVTNASVAVLESAAGRYIGWESYLDIVSRYQSRYRDSVWINARATSEPFGRVRRAG